MRILKNAFIIVGRLRWFSELVKKMKHSIKCAKLALRLNPRLGVIRG